MDNKTIYALSTVFGKSGVAIFRISGTKAIDAIKKMTTIDTINIKPRYAYFSKIYTIEKQLIDNAIVLYFKAPNSFSGEDSVEIQCHGSKAVISSILDSLSKIENFRLAEAGEFSRRAFYNNKMDLTEAEGLADLIDAETSEQQKYALRQMNGDLKDLYDGWRTTMVNVLAHLEAYIDFPDEKLPQNIVSNLENTVFKVREEIRKHLSQSNYGEKLRDGFRVVILGEPNAGKSSLLNTLAQREAVIVSDVAGTTRDAIDVYMDINGYPVIFTDTAGLRITDEEIEKKGIEIAFSKAKEADLIIALVNAEHPNLNIFENLLSDCKDKIIFVLNKTDCIDEKQCFKFRNNGFITLSVKQKTGINELIDIIKNKISSNFNQSSTSLITRKRYREVLNDVFKDLENFNLSKNIELSTEDIRLSIRNIGKITGRVEIDEILDKIFGSFCIGK